ncbi:uncharacterized protein J8A68_001045 [[Candida] subhashii]|uniref:Uncharacterized protein n=1 Tax=[Candida] subhashii TaxID=561895 RepID=A0A8J5USP9_9ASCO|nr:uncharacterized protein J8A68_001045 [[Candida] subhashii]KAG7665357.1 hypothetical protein J8A68_001045 [[Candida] subhashii]
MTQYLSKESLFLKLPTSEPPKQEITLQDLYNELKTDNYQYTSVINKTYYILKSSTNLTHSQLLKLWSIRLTLHLFNDQLNYAKKESINLNNALYLNENSNISPSNTPPPPPNRGTGQPGLAPVYPLPRNNQNLLDHNLVILLLRLKSIPNLNLINELYKLNYQLRLRPQQVKQEDLRSRLINLSYDTIVILFITNNLQTLRSFLLNLYQELKLNGEVSSLVYSQYLSNITLVLIIVETVIFVNLKETNIVNKVIQEKYGEVFMNQVNQESKLSLVYTVRSIAPIRNESLDSDFVIGNNPDLGEIIKLVQDGRISGRIICSMLGIWDLLNNFPQFKLVQIEDEIQLTNERDKPSQEEANDDGGWLDLAYQELNGNWYKYIHKVYGLE